MKYPEAWPIAIKCPACDRFLAEGSDYVRAVCRDCGCEIRYRSKARRLSVPLGEELDRERLPKAAVTA